MTRSLLHCLLPFFIISALMCAPKKKRHVAVKPVIERTTVQANFLPELNDYRPLTAQRIIRDTLVHSDTTDDESALITIKDTAYIVWMLSPVLDSLKRPVKMKAPNTERDSVKGNWVGWQRKFIMQDLNYDWGVK